MRNFDRDNKRGGGRDFKRRDISRGHDTRRPQMHKTICSNCSKECEVPFIPTGDRPVYCRDCFAKNGGGDFKKSFDRDTRANLRPMFQKFNEEVRNSPSTEQYQEIIAKLDQIVRLLTPVTPKTAAQSLEEETVAIPEEQKTMVKKKKVSKKMPKTPLKTPNE